MSFFSKKMKHIDLVNNVKIPIVGLGMWQVENDEEIDFVVENAIEAGYRHFDTATKYKNEKGLGRALKKAIDNGKVKREGLFVVTKLPCIAMKPDKVTRFIKQSLESLQLDYIDLYLIHWPFGFQYTDKDDDLVPMKDGKILFDMSTDLISIWKEMEAQVLAGRIKSIGLSNFSASQVERIVKIAKIQPTVNQVELHAYFQQKELLSVCSKHNVSICAYAPLGSPGRSKYVIPGIGTLPVPQLLQDDLVNKLAKKYNKSPGQILLRFITQLNVIVIPKSSNPQRLQENLNIFDFELSPEEMKEMEKLDKGEMGRSFTGFPGMKNHPECPF